MSDSVVSEVNEVELLCNLTAFPFVFLGRFRKTNSLLCQKIMFFLKTERANVTPNRESRMLRWVCVRSGNASPCPLTANKINVLGICNTGILCVCQVPVE